ncbi:hypothetical protein BDW75DRAFT_221033 [Aspergillus navahoensis]
MISMAYSACKRYKTKVSYSSSFLFFWWWWFYIQCTCLYATMCFWTSRVHLQC